MGKVYNTQDFLAIKSQYSRNISSQIASGVIKYIDPDGLTGQWDAIHDSANKQFVYEPPLGTTLKAGRWKAWSYATMLDGRHIPGEPDTFLIRVEGA